MGIYTFPHTRNYDSDLCYLIRKVKENRELIDNFVKTSEITYANPIQWDIARNYPKYQIVLDEKGDAYLSAQPVSPNIELSNTDYWIKVFNYDAQLGEFKLAVEELQKATDQKMEDLEKSIDEKSKELSKVVSDAAEVTDQKLKDIEKKIADVKLDIDMTLFDYNVKAYKTSSNTYAAAFNDCVSAIKASGHGGTITIPGDVTVQGPVTLDVNKVKVTGGGYVKDGLTIKYHQNATETDNISITGLNFIGTNGIELIDGNYVRISDCDFNVTNYGIYYNGASSNSQRMPQCIFSNNNFRGRTAISFDNSTSTGGNNGLADVIIANNQMNNTVNNVVIKKADGVNIYNNVMFLSTGAKTKERHIDLVNNNFTIISGNELFESGHEAIRINNPIQDVIISDNNIVWPAQRSRTSAIDVRSGADNNVGVSVTGNRINRPTSNGIYVDTNRPIVSNNSIYDPGNTEHILEGSAAAEMYGIVLINSETSYTIGNATIGVNKVNMITSTYGIKFNCVSTTQLESNLSTSGGAGLSVKNIYRASDFAVDDGSNCVYIVNADVDITSMSSIINGKVATGYIFAIGGNFNQNGSVKVNRYYTCPILIVNNNITYFASKNIGS